MSLAPAKRRTLGQKIAERDALAAVSAPKPKRVRAAVKKVAKAVKKVAKKK